MPKNEKDFEIVSELAKEVAENGVLIQMKSSPENESHEDSTDSSEEINDDLSQDPPTPQNDKKKRKNKSEKTAPTLKDLAIRKQTQNLEQREQLLDILAKLFGIQLFFMNAVVLLIIFWGVFDCKCFRPLDPDVLKSILDFTRYYVTAVLVELLGGVIYMVQRVFSDKN